MNKYLSVLVMLALPTALYAQQGGEPDSMISVIVGNAGLPGWATIAMSIVAFTLVIKLLMDTRIEKVLPASVAQHVEDLLNEEDYDGALNSVSGDSSFLGRVLFGGLSKMNGGAEAVGRGLDEAWETEQTSFLQVASYVQLAAQLAPMLGLFGTVSGMMEAFSVLAQSSGAANPKQLAKGIMFALVTTFIGLLVSIPCNIAYLFIRNKIVTVGLEVGMRASGALDAIFSKGDGEGEE